MSAAETARRTRPVRPEQELVFRALEATNIVHGRPVTVDELLQALTESEVRQLKALGRSNLSMLTSVIVRSLCKRGLAVRSGKQSRKNAYLSTSVGDRGVPSLERRSRRGSVLELVERLVPLLGRAVRTWDVISHLHLSELAGVPSARIAQSMLSLAATGDLLVIGTVRGGGARGSHLYLPKSLAIRAGDYLPREPLSWLEYVIKAFEGLWAEAETHAREEGAKPRPISTDQVRSRLQQTGGHPNLDDPRLLGNAMKNLASGQDPLLRKIKSRTALWVPVSFGDDTIDASIFAKDSERVIEAARRAIRRTSSVAVTGEQMEYEMSKDPSLRPIGQQRFTRYLDDLCRAVLSDGKGIRVERVERCIIRVGEANGEPYYAVVAPGEDAECAARRARPFLIYRNAEARWAVTDAHQRLSKLEGCRLPSVAVGRALLIAADATAIADDLQAAEEAGEAAGIDRSLGALAREVRAVAEMAQGWAVFLRRRWKDLPTTVNINVPGLTPAELMAAAAPVYPPARRARGVRKLISLLSGAINRIPNPDFVSHRSADPARSSQFLFDRTEALIYGAKRWGGRESRIQAVRAAQTLERLRDVRFIYPSMETDHVQTRLLAVACLAYLPAPHGLTLLERAVLHDVDAGVRQAALWAYGFAGGLRITELVNAAKQDEDGRVRGFAKEAASLASGSWCLL